MLSTGLAPAQLDFVRGSTHSVTLDSHASSLIAACHSYSPHCYPGSHIIRARSSLGFAVLFAVLSAQAAYAAMRLKLEGARKLSRLLSEEALTVAVLLRWHINQSIKRQLGHGLEYGEIRMIVTLKSVKLLSGVVTSIFTATALLLAAGTNIALAKNQGKSSKKEALAPFCADQARLCMDRTGGDQGICRPRQARCMQTGCFPHIAKFGGPVCAPK